MSRGSDFFRVVARGLAEISTSCFYFLGCHFGSSSSGAILRSFPTSSLLDLRNWVVKSNFNQVFVEIMVRGRDACWEHCVLVDATKQKVRCNYCEREFSGGVYRMKFHLAQIKNKDIVPCSKVPHNVRDHIRGILSTPKKPRTPKKSKLDLAANGQQNSSSGSENSHVNSSGQRGSSGPPLLSPQVSPDIPPAPDDCQKPKQDHADKKVAMFFFRNAIPFGAAKSVYYQEMVDSIAECGIGYKAPSQEKLRTALLEKVRDDIHDCYRKYREDWKEFGCTVLCETGPDARTKSIVAITVTCPKGSIFLKSVDVSGHQDDANYLFEMLESVILEVGIENVVQMLEDMSKQEWICTVLEDAKTIIHYIHSNPWILNMMRKFCGGKELMRPRITGLVSDFLCLRVIVVHEENLKCIFSHNEWLSSIYSRHTEAQTFKSLLFSERFWRSAHEVINVWEPLVKILRIVNGDMPAIGYLYEAIEKAKIMIKMYYKGIEERYLPVWEIIDHRWSMQLLSPLYAAAASLNPSIFYSSNLKSDPKVRNGFQEVMLKVASSEDEKRNITIEHPVYINSQGALGTDLAVIGRTVNAPGDWWAAFGYEIPTLQRMATRILSQPCSSHWCRWNWSTFKGLHSKTRTKSEFDRFSQLVFVHCNLRLKGMCQRRDGRCKPVLFDEIDVSLEWPTELEPSAPTLDDSWLGDLHLEVQN